MLKAACLALIAISFISCTGVQKQNCASTNWYELGRQKGVTGQLKNGFKKQVNSCENPENPRYKNLYSMGYKAGLSQFCTEDTAFTLGKAGAPYNHVCPLHLEEDFMTFYNKGLKVYNLQRSNLGINYELENILSKIRSEKNENNKNILNRRLSQLKKAKAKNDQQIKEFSKIY